MTNHVPSPVDLLSDKTADTALNPSQRATSKKKNSTRPKAKPKKVTSTAKASAKPKPKATAPTTAMPKAKASDDLVVFAFRLSAEERDLIHQASGPARASRFVRAVALAAARGDAKALQAILVEVQRGSVA